MAAPSWEDDPEGAGHGVQLLCKVPKPEPKEEEHDWTVLKVHCTLRKFCLGDVVRVPGVVL